MISNEFVSKNVLFFDIGSSCTRVTLALFNFTEKNHESSFFFYKIMFYKYLK